MSSQALMFWVGLATGPAVYGLARILGVIWVDRERKLYAMKHLLEDIQKYQWGYEQAKTRINEVLSKVYE